MVDDTVEDDVNTVSDDWRGSSARNGIRWTTFAIRPSIVGQLVVSIQGKTTEIHEPITSSNSVSRVCP